MAPAFVELAVKSDVDKRPPPRLFGLSNQVHVRFVNELVSFAGVAGNARANDIFPGREAAFVSGDDVVEIQLRTIKNFAAILAGIFIPLENVVTCEFDFFARKAIEETENNDGRYPDFQ